MNIKGRERDEYQDGSQEKKEIGGIIACYGTYTYLISLTLSGLVDHSLI